MLTTQHYLQALDRDDARWCTRYFRDRFEMNQNIYTHDYCIRLAEFHGAEMGRVERQSSLLLYTPLSINQNGFLKNYSIKIYYIF